jgi:pimeloyl-ACP methyl ester carboxylesterase
LRGHGESGWAADGAYQIEDRAGDVAAILKATGARVILVGASMWGNTFLYASATLRIAPLALVLVDIVPKPDVAGVSRIKKFMQSHLDGFATLDEALEAVAVYNPNRRRTNSPDGLRKNLRERNGRLYWHWDPAILEITAEEETRKVNVALGNPVEPLTFPALLVRGAQTDVVSAEGIEGLRAYLPHLEVTDVTGAGHMVAGDRNDVFNRAIVDFLAPLK